MDTYIALFFFWREQIPEEYFHHDPEHRFIYEFVRTLFRAAQLTAECAIVTLVRYFFYLVSFLSRTQGMDLFLK